ncbi:P-loop containing nucleoside triphosphate hydrolase protein, partial [Pavlovales sp. CCMP2436]
RLGGLPAEVRRALSDLRLSLHRPELFEALGVRPVRGCLISGPPGSGRTAVARALAADAAGGEARVLHASAPQLVAALGAAGLDGELHALFARACALAPCVVCIDELEMIAPPRAAAGASGGGGDEASARVVGALLTALDGVCASARVALVATSSGGEALEPALRRPGRLDLELELAPPSGRARLEVLCKMAPALPARVARALAARSHGYVPADLAAVLRELSWAPAAAAADDAGSDSAAAPAEKLAPEQLRAIAAALARVPPSALRDAQLEIPEVGWDDIGGQDESIAALREAVEWPLRYASTFARLGVRAPRGVLLYGPPGCSKTLTAKAIASTSGLNFVAVKGPELFSKWVGESEKAVQLLFKKARAAAPAIIFFDEIDALAPARAGGGGGSAVGMRVLAQLLHEMDGVGGADASGERAHVVVLGATNRPDLIDGALLRPGRFDRLLYVGLPDEPARLAVLKVHTRRTPLAAEVSLQAVAARTDGYSGAELAALCREAAMCALTETLEAPDVGARHFDAALATVSPRTPRSLLDLYARYQSRASGT